MTLEVMRACPQENVQTSESRKKSSLETFSRSEDRGFEKVINKKIKEKTKTKDSSQVDEIQNQAAGNPEAVQDVDQNKPRLGGDTKDADRATEGEETNQVSLTEDSQTKDSTLLGGETGKNLSKELRTENNPSLTKNQEKAMLQDHLGQEDSFGKEEILTTDGKNPLNEHTSNEISKAEVLEKASTTMNLDDSAKTPMEGELAVNADSAEDLLAKAGRKEGLEQETQASVNPSEGEEAEKSELSPLSADDEKIFQDVAARKNDPKTSKAADKASNIIPMDQEVSEDSSTLNDSTKMTVNDLRSMQDVKNPAKAAVENNQVSNTDAPIAGNTGEASSDLNGGTDSQSGQNPAGTEIVMDFGKGQSTGTTGRSADSPQAFSQMLSDHLQESGNAEIVKNMGVTLKDNNMGEIKLILKPESLGNVKILLDMNENHIAGRIIVENSSVREVFEQNMESLAKALKDSGFNMSEMQVSVGDDSGSSSQEEKGKRKDPFYLRGVKEIGRQTEMTSSYDSNSIVDMVV